MKLVASMNVKDEMGRYLPMTIGHLASYCDEIRVQDDWSEDGSFEWLQSQPRVVVQRNPGPRWTENEGELHQNLLDFTLQAEPTHVLAIDADELVPEGADLRSILERDNNERTFTLRMCEIWHTDTDPWLMRVDGGWRAHPVGVLYRCPPHLPKSGKKADDWRIWGRKMAGGRVPRIIRTDQHTNQCRYLDMDILHLGWSRPSERQRRYDRYVEVDGGNFHNSEHLDSIMLPDEKIALRAYDRTLDEDIKRSAAMVPA